MLKRSEIIPSQSQLCFKSYENYLQDVENCRKFEMNSLTNQSNIIKQSKSTTSQYRPPHCGISTEPATEGYIEFVRKVENIEWRIAIAYFTQCILRLLLESGFLYLQCRFFDFNVPELYKCRRWPCPNTVCFYFFTSLYFEKL